MFMYVTDIKGSDFRLTVQREDLFPCANPSSSIPFADTGPCLDSVELGEGWIVCIAIGVGSFYDSVWLTVFIGTLSDPPMYCCFWKELQELPTTGSRVG